VASVRAVTPRAPAPASAASLPGAILTSFATAERHAIAARSTLSEEALVEFERRAQDWLRKHSARFEAEVDAFMAR
jgi:hypothetical protein